jgi:hypothetical protein
VKLLIQWAILLVAILPLCSSALERLEPSDGCYLGFTLQTGDTISNLSSRLGITPALYGRYFMFPFPESNAISVNEFLNEALGFGAIAMLTVEPWAGLENVTENDCLALAMLCAAFESRGITGIFIRFAHEMNGNWYPWGQQPALFKQRFRLLAEFIRKYTTRTALLWAPNHGLGYPFGTPIPKRDSVDFVALDTDRDGLVTQQDDMYEPFYPGDDAVDWVGLSLYHWGNPWLENAPPPANAFVRAISGMYGAPTPNFYSRYCAGPIRRKPMAIPETAAFYNTERLGSTELDVKQGWWQQVFNSGSVTQSTDVATYFPEVKFIGWFDELKREGVADNNWIDWRVSADPIIRSSFVTFLRALRTQHRPPHYLTAMEARCLLLEDGCIGGERFAIRVTSDQRHFSWPSVQDLFYQLFVSSDLIRWIPLGPTIPGTGEKIQILPPPLSPESSSAFYRVQLLSRP